MELIDEEYVLSMIEAINKIEETGDDGLFPKIDEDEFLDQLMKEILKEGLRGEFLNKFLSEVFNELVNYSHLESGEIHGNSKRFASDIFSKVVKAIKDHTLGVKLTKCIETNAENIEDFDIKKMDIHSIPEFVGERFELIFLEPFIDKFCFYVKFLRWLLIQAKGEENVNLMPSYCTNK